MRKIYSVLLAAVSLLFSANLSAVDVNTLAGLQEAIDNTAAGATVNIRLTADITMATTDMPIRIYGKYAEAGKTVNLDLNGKNIIVGKGRAIELFKGTLNITGSGEIRKTDKGGKVYANADGNKEMVFVAGSWNTNDANWSNLTIGKDVRLNATVAEGKAITINEFLFTQTGSGPSLANYTITDPRSYIDNTVDGVKLATPAYFKRGDVGIVDYCTNWKNYTSTGAQAKKNLGKAYGANVHIYGYVYGQEYGVKINGVITATDGENIPMVYIHSGAEVAADKVMGSNAVYCSGYGKTIIEGTVHGANGVYVKGGDVTLNDAIVYSEYNGTYTEPQATSSGVVSAGSGVVVESSGSYVGQHTVTVTGDTKVTGGSGYAIEETVTNVEDSKVNSVTIQSGTIEAGEQGAVIVDERTADEDAKIVIVGGNYSEDSNGEPINIKVKGDEEITEKPVTTFVPDEVKDHYTTTTFTDTETGKTTIVVTYFENKDDKPAEKTSVITKDGEGNYTNEGKGVAWKVTEDAVETIDQDLTLTYLEAIDATHKQTLNVGDATHKVTLTVGRIVLGANAQIVVAAGSRLIVNGDQGIVANSVDNIILTASEDGTSQFLFNPAVTSNRHPNATVEFITKSFWTSNNDGDYAFQRFGIPTYVQIANIETPVMTRLYSYDWSSNTWKSRGVLNSTQDPIDYSYFKDPFESYQMLTYTAAEGTVYKMKGELVGNINADLEVGKRAKHAFANSYTGNIDIETLVNDGTYGNVYVYRRLTNNTYTWDPVGIIDFEDDEIPPLATQIQPLQGFYVMSTDNVHPHFTLDYDGMLWTPAVGGASAPRRVAADLNRTLAQIRVMSNNENVDNLTLIGSDRYTAEFEDGYDALKLMNDGFNIYVSADEKMSRLATDNLEGAYLGVSTAQAGIYTLTFTNIKGEQLVLVDLLNGSKTVMTEGASYQFYLADSESNDYRFQIVGRASMPTDVEEVEAAVKGNGVYSLTGQYMGNMSVWNTLPAGVYVVDGVKRVK